MNHGGQFVSRLRFLWWPLGLCLTMGWGRKNSQGSGSRTLLWPVAETNAPRLKSVPPNLQMIETSQAWPEFKIAIATPIPKGAGPFMKIKLAASAPRSRFPATLRVDAR
jgi:hypothetical protein